MIIKARSRSGGRQLARYLLTKNETQQARVLDTRGSATDDLKTMLHTLEVEARATSKAFKALYHLMVRLAPGEQLSVEQWFRVLNTVEQELGLSGCARAVIAHDLSGERHLHAVYSRLDPSTGMLVKMSHDHRAHHATARQMEEEFGLRHVSSTPRRDRSGNERTRSNEYRMAKESGSTHDEICRLVQEAWHNSHNKEDFERQLVPYQ